MSDEPDNMKIQEIDSGLLDALHDRARASERLRMNFDLRTSAEDGSQRMLNALQPGTQVAIHRHLQTAETVVCLQGCLDVVCYELISLGEKPETRQSGCRTVSVDGEEIRLGEVHRVRLNPQEGRFGVQIPVGVWHTVEVHEPSTIFEAKDGKYIG